MTKKIAITGPESSGKTTLVEALSEHYCSPWIPEFARIYLQGTNGTYAQKDLDQIVEGQLELENKFRYPEPKYLFCDSDVLVVKIWSEYKFGSISKLINNAWDEADYDFHLLMYPDTDWTFDPLRESESKRDTLFTLYQKALEESGRPYSIITGLKDKRLKNAITSIEAHFGSS